MVLFRFRFRLHLLGLTPLVHLRWLLDAFTPRGSTGIRGLDRPSREGRFSPTVCERGMDRELWRESLTDDEACTADRDAPDSAEQMGLWTDLPAAAYARSGEGGQGAEQMEYPRSGEGGQGAEQRALWKNTLWNDLAAYARSGEGGQD